MAVVLRFFRDSGDISSARRYAHVEAARNGDSWCLVHEFRFDADLLSVARRFEPANSNRG
jgi:hypothetical protein